MTSDDLEAKIGAQVQELETLIGQMENEQRLLTDQITELQVMRLRLLAVQASLRSVRTVN